MNDFIDPTWEKYIKVSYSEALKNNASSIVSHLEKNKILDYKKIDGTKISSIKIGNSTFVYLPNNESYDWHSDSACTDLKSNKLTIQYHRFWIRLSYLTEGNPLEIGNWNSTGTIIGRDRYKIRKPNILIARIFPKPGKIVIFPSMMIHRVNTDTSNKKIINRWVMREFFETHNVFLNLSTIEIKDLYKKYFGNDYNWD